ncbi:hypothetical protein MHYP_G00013440 [Metynnis hypsauchen]
MVTLTCGIGSGDGWQYEWFKNNKPLSGAEWRNEYAIYIAAKSDRGLYTCKGRLSTAPSYSETSAAVTLTVSGKPKPTVRVEDPQSSVYTGDTVTLTCEVESTGWEFLWYKDSQTLQPQSPADKNPNTVRVTVSDEGTAEFRCKASRKSYDYSHNHYDYTTQLSDPVQIRVTARPKATVTIKPAGPVFIGETVTLTCDIRSGDGWYYDWFKDNKTLSEAQQNKKYTISKVAASDGGLYTCRGRQSTAPRYSETSAAVTLTVSGE